MTMFWVHSVTDRDKCCGLPGQGHPAGSLASSYLGGPPFWVSPLAFIGLIVYNHRIIFFISYKVLNMVRNFWQELKLLFLVFTILVHINSLFNTYGSRELCTEDDRPTTVDCARICAAYYIHWKQLVSFTFYRYFKLIFSILPFLPYVGRLWGWQRWDPPGRPEHSW
jgi:hypothetical protein